MDKTPSSEGACCLPNAEGVTYLRVGPRGVTVGMMNLDAVFKQLFAMNRRPEEATDAELLGMARRFNYIPDRPGIVADYAAALHWLSALWRDAWIKGGLHADRTL